MILEALGYNSELESHRKAQNLEQFAVGRVATEHKERYIVRTEAGEFDCELIGNLRFSATDRYALPAVGDWVALSEYDAGKALIHAIYPRTSILERQAVGKYGQTQIIATNVDTGLIVQSVNRDFSINRLERYLTICHNANIDPVIVLSKTDLLDSESLNDIEAEIRQRIDAAPLILLSNVSLAGLDAIRSVLAFGKTFCMLGSSGVGKSTLINRLAGWDAMATGAISDTIDRGRHVTTSRSIIVLESGGILIDNPGIREVGVADAEPGLAITFQDIVELADQCHFRDCTHTSEKGCAVIAAVKSGELLQEDYDNFQKMAREIEHFGSTVAERRKKDKNFGKMVKQAKKHKKGDNS